MKKAILSVLLFLFVASAALAGYVNGYYRSNGTYVNSYYRTDSNYTVQDNYSYKGNYNPHTGSSGTNYYRHSRSSSYYTGD